MERRGHVADQLDLHRRRQRDQRPLRSGGRVDQPVQQHLGQLVQLSRRHRRRHHHRHGRQGCDSRQPGQRYRPYPAGQRLDLRQRQHRQRHRRRRLGDARQGYVDHLQRRHLGRQRQRARSGRRGRSGDQQLRQPERHQGHLHDDAGLGEHRASDRRHGFRRRHLGHDGDHSRGHSARVGHGRRNRGCAVQPRLGRGHRQHLGRFHQYESVRLYNQGGRRQRCRHGRRPQPVQHACDQLRRQRRRRLLLCERRRRQRYLRRRQRHQHHRLQRCRPWRHGRPRQRRRAEHRRRFGHDHERPECRRHRLWRHADRHRRREPDHRRRRRRHIGIWRHAEHGRDLRVRRLGPLDGDDRRRHRHADRRRAADLLRQDRPAGRSVRRERRRLPARAGCDRLRFGRRDHPDQGRADLFGIAHHGVGTGRDLHRQARPHPARRHRGRRADHRCGHRAELRPDHRVGAPEQLRRQSLGRRQRRQHDVQRRPSQGGRRDRQQGAGVLGEQRHGPEQLCRCLQDRRGSVRGLHLRDRDLHQRQRDHGERRDHGLHDRRQHPQ